MNQTGYPSILPNSHQTGYLSHHSPPSQQKNKTLLINQTGYPFILPISIKQDIYPITLPLSTTVKSINQSNRLLIHPDNHAFIRHSTNSRQPGRTIRRSSQEQRRRREPEQGRQLEKSDSWVIRPEWVALRKYSFSVRTVDSWDNLPKDV